MVKLIFFASIREDLGVSAAEEAVDGATTVAELVQVLGLRYGSLWTEVLSRENILIAVNQAMAGLQHPIVPGDEVAFFPPVTGG
jgi:sulfur-carrier protein